MARSEGEGEARIRLENRTPSTDERFEVLADRHRRAALSCLLERDSPVSVDELIDEVLSSVESDPTTVDDNRDRLRTRFLHVHLPKLHNVGAIEYQAGPQVVEPQPVINDFEKLLGYADQLSPAKV